jgi:hypothetical protein
MKRKNLKINNPMEVIIGHGNYNIFNVLSEFNKQKHTLITKLKGQSIEGYSDDDPAPFFGTFFGILIIIIALAIWIWALVITIKYFNIIPIWAQILSVLGLFGIGGPILTILVVYIGKNMNMTKSSSIGQKHLSYTNSVLGKRSMFLG